MLTDTSIRCNLGLNRNLIDGKSWILICFIEFKSLIFAPANEENAMFTEVLRKM